MAAGAGEQLYPRLDDKWSGSRLRLWLTAVSLSTPRRDTTNPPPQVFHSVEKSAWANLPHHPSPSVSTAMPLLAGPNLRSLSLRPTATIKSRGFIEVAPDLSNYPPVTNSMANLESISLLHGNVICSNNRKARNRWDNNSFNFFWMPLETIFNQLYFISINSYSSYSVLITYILFCLWNLF